MDKRNELAAKVERMELKLLETLECAMGLAKVLQAETSRLNAKLAELEAKIEKGLNREG